MGIRYNSRLSKHVSHDQIGTFSPYSRKFQQRIEIIRNLSTIFIPEHLHTGTDISCFALSQDRRVLRSRSISSTSAVCQCFYCRIFLIKTFHDYIYLLHLYTVAASLTLTTAVPCLIIIKRASCIRILFLQSLQSLQAHAVSLSFISPRHFSLILPLHS